MLKELNSRRKFWKHTNRIGVDIPGTHWRLYLPSLMLKLYKTKSKHFDDTAEFRPGAYAVGCSQISIGKRVIIRPHTMLQGETETLDTSIIMKMM